MPASSTTRIVVVDDHEILRKGIVQLLEATGDYAVVGEAASAAEAHDAIRLHEPDLVIADLVLGEGPDGIQLTKALKAHRPFLPVLLLSAHDESLFAERALDAGASGYVMKDEAVDTLLDAIKAALEGGIWLSADMWQRLDASVAMVRAGAGGAAPAIASEALAVEDPDLPPTEARMLEEVRRGNWTTQGLARSLDMSWAEVERIRRSLCTVLGLRSDIELVLYAHRGRRAGG